KYFLLVEKGVVPVVIAGRGHFPDISEDTLKAMRALLTAAAKATENDAASHRRVAFLRAGFEFTAISTEAHRLADAAEKTGKPADANAVSAVMERRWQMMRAIVQNQPLAVNVSVVSANDGPLFSALGWKGPSAAGKAGKFRVPAGDDWLNEDQS